MAKVKENTKTTTPQGVQDYIEQNSAYVVDLIQMLLEIACPNNCKECIWADVCTN